VKYYTTYRDFCKHFFCGIVTKISGEFLADLPIFREISGINGGGGLKRYTAVSIFEK